LVIDQNPCLSHTKQGDGLNSTIRARLVFETSGSMRSSLVSHCTADQWTRKISKDNPERFTDFRINNRDFQHSSTVFTRDVTSALKPVMARRFPGHTLNLRYTNIDLV
jgi:hypothetical protein